MVADAALDIVRESYPTVHFILSLLIGDALLKVPPPPPLRYRLGSTRWTRTRVSRPGLTPTLSDQLTLRVCLCALCILTVCENASLVYVRIYVIYRVNHSEYSIRILGAALQQSLSPASRRRAPARLGQSEPRMRLAVRGEPKGALRTHSA